MLGDECLDHLVNLLKLVKNELSLQSVTNSINQWLSCTREQFVVVAWNTNSHARRHSLRPPIKEAGQN